MVVALVVLMVNLGFWQLRRLDGRKEINASIRAREKAPAVDIAQLQAAGDPGAIEYRMATATGVFNVVRNLGGGAGVAVVSMLLARRTQEHQSTLVPHVNPFDAEKAARLF